MSALAKRETIGFSPHALLTWPLRHVRWKIVLPYALLTVSLAVVGSYLAARLVTSSLSDRFDNQLTEAGRVVSDSVVRKEREHLKVVRSVAFTEGMATAVQGGDAGTVTRLARPLGANAKVERLQVLDAGGRRLETMTLSDPEALSYTPMADSDDPASWPLVQKVLAGETDELGDKYAQIVQAEDGFVLYTAGPIKSGDQTVGVVLVGTTLESFVIQAKTESLADITLYDFQGNPMVSTYVQPEEPTGEADLSMTPEALETVVPGSESLIEHRSLWGRGHDLVYGRLEVRDQAVGLYSAGLPTEFIFNAGSTTRTQVALLFGIGMAAVMGIGLVLAHLLTRPILRLVRTARKVSAGDLSARSGVHSSDEIGTLASSFDEMTERLQRQHLSTIRALTSAIDARDPYTMGHSVRVGQLAMMVGRKLGLDDVMLSRLEVGGYLHDIGKIGVRDNVLLKPGKLTDEERHAIEDHPRIGLAILEAVELPREVLQFVEGHHERLDGTGYPHGLRDSEVPIIARIGAVADIYDALTSERPYRGPSRPQEALALLRSDAVQKLDPQVLDALEAVLPDWEQRRLEEPELSGFRLPELHPENVAVRR
jgi:putative nucleotidyltransferase with HDIG domain